VFYDIKWIISGAFESGCPLGFETGGTMGYNCCFFLNFVPLHIESPYNFRDTGPILGVKNPLQRVNGHAVNLKKKQQTIRKNWSRYTKKLGVLNIITQYGCFESCQFRPRSVFFLSWCLNKSAGDFRCLRYYRDNVSIS
jgi:hypothetical protein